MLRRLLDLDFVVLSVISVLCLLSVVVLYGIFGATDFAHLPVRQSFFAGLSLFALIILGLSQYDFLRTFSTLIYIFGLCFLVFVLFFGVEINGTVGWIDMGFALLQPVEFAKIALIVFLAHFISYKRAHLGEGATIIGSIFFTGLYVFLVLMQPDAGSALVLIAIWSCMILVAGIRKRSIVVFALLGVCLAWCGWLLLAPYQKDRIATFLHPEQDPQNTGYNVIQSLIAIGNGGFTGRGVGGGTQSSLNFLPEQHTDFIFASYTEAFGFLGSLCLLILFGVIFFRLYRTAQFARDAFGYFLCIGVMTLLFVHVTVNIGMNMGLLPVTGIPLPFVSYGGSALLSMSIAMGIVMSVYRMRQKIQDRYIRESY